MTVLEILNQFYSDLILVKRDSEQTAMTYKISVEEFLSFLVREKIKLRAVSTQDLILFLIKRQEEGVSELTIAKEVSAVRAFG